MCSQIKAAFSLLSFQWVAIKYSSTLNQKTKAIPKVVLNPPLMSYMVKTKITPRAKYPDRTQKFIKAVQEALEAFKDQVGSLTEEIRSNAYKDFLEAHRDTLTPVWNLARFANIETILATIANPQMTELAAMAQQLKPAPVSSSIVKEKRKVPDLETISTTLKDKFLFQNLLDTKVCEKIGEVFAKLSEANKAYAGAAKGLTDLSTLVTPEQYTMLLTPATTPAIQIVVSGGLITPLTAPPPPLPPATTALGRSEILNCTKLKVLPNPDSTALAGCDKNSATRGLTTAVYSKLEHHFFDDTLSRMDITSAFRCNVSQLSKAVTGIDYASGPHNYKPKEKKTPTKRTSDEPDPNPEQAKKASRAPKKSDTAHPTTSQL